MQVRPATVADLLTAANFRGETKAVEFYLTPSQAKILRHKLGSDFVTDPDGVYCVFVCHEDPFMAAIKSKTPIIGRLEQTSADAGHWEDLRKYVQSLIKT